MPLKPRKLMVLGAGQCQVPLIEMARNMGFYTIVVSSPGNYPGVSIADRAYPIDVRDKEHILDIAQKEGICGIITDQTDLPVSSVAYVAEKMHLPGNTYDCALRFTNKHLMRQRCKELRVPVPRHYQATSLDEGRAFLENLGLPLIIKPVDSQGSRGVTKVESSHGFDNIFQESLSFSNYGAVIMEEFVSGRELVIQGFVHNGTFSTLAVGDREYFTLSNKFIPKRTTFPSLIDKALQDKVTEINARLIMGFRPSFGLTHSEFLVNETSGAIWLVETALRGGGVFISSDLVPLCCGINTNKLLIELSTGNMVANLDHHNSGQGAAGYICFSLPEGKIVHVEGLDSISRIPGVHKACLGDITVGKLTHKMTDKTMRLGPILVSGENRGDLQDTIDRIMEIFQVGVMTSQGMSGIIW